MSLDFCFRLNIGLTSSESCVNVLPFLHRWYVQLPTEKAHEYHEGEPIAISAASNNTCVITNYAPSENSVEGSRLNPNVATKIRNMVAAGETRLYVIRQLLRYVLV